MPKERDFLIELRGEQSARKRRLAGLRKAATTLKERVLYPDSQSNDEPDPIVGMAIRYDTRHAPLGQVPEDLRRTLPSDD